MSDDDISLNSSGSDQEEEYSVEEILAECLSEDLSPRFLVRWENYGDERYDYSIPMASPIHMLFESLLSCMLTHEHQDVHGNLPNHLSTLAACRTGQRSAMQVLHSPTTSLATLTPKSTPISMPRHVEEPKDRSNGNY
jgi:hypothetical protein